MGVLRGARTKEQALVPMVVMGAARILALLVVAPRVDLAAVQEVPVEAAEDFHAVEVALVAVEVVVRAVGVARVGEAVVDVVAEAVVAAAAAIDTVIFL